MRIATTTPGTDTTTATSAEKGGRPPPKGRAEFTGSPADFDATTKGVVGLHAGGGVNLDLTNNVFIGAEGRYLWAKPSFGGQDVKLDGFTVTGNLGFRF